MKLSETHPKHHLDKWLWPLLKIIWEPWSLKRSHWWHWRNIESAVICGAPTITSPGNPEAKLRQGLWPNFWQTNFGWENAIIVRLKDKNLGRNQYRIGFIEPSGRSQICSIIVNGTIALLEGPEPVRFFAITFPSGWWVELEIVKSGVRKWNLDKDIPLL